MHGQGRLRSREGRNMQGRGWNISSPKPSSSRDAQCPAGSQQHKGLLREGTSLVHDHGGAHALLLSSYPGMGQQTLPWASIDAAKDPGRP